MNIWLVWATNVGKSTLFNRLIWQFRAIVTDIAGTTIDILKHETYFENLGNVTFSDSPGLSDFSEERPFIQQIIDESDLILFVVDDTVGITAKEKQIFKYIVDSGKKDKTILIVNKLDNKRKTHEYDIAILDYYNYGFSHIVGVSAKNENNLEEILKILRELHKKYKTNNKKAENSENLKKQLEWITQLAIVWKPNVGKSTLLNHLIGEQLSKIEDKAGTTRDYVFGDFKKWKHKYRLYDTAGIKKKWKMQSIEKIAYQKTLKMLEFIRPMVLFLVDAEEGITHRDMSLLAEIHLLKLPIIVCLNKCDLLDTKQIKTLTDKTQVMLDFAKYIPIIPLSALKWTGESDIFKMIKLLRKESHKRIDTNSLNKAIANDRITRPPRFPKNKVCKIFYATQVETHPPTFKFFINHENRTNFAFKRWIENTIRLHFGFIGTPIRVYFTQREKKRGQSEKDLEKNVENEAKKSIQNIIETETIK